MIRDQPADHHITYFANTNHRSTRRFGIKERDRRSHMYLIGKTGTGKSTLILNLVASDLAAGNGLVLIDPHGDLALAALDRVPPNRIDEVIYFDPADLEYPIGFNPLEAVDPSQRHLVASGLIGTLKKVWPAYWGPRLEHILRHVFLTLLEVRGSTLLHVPRLLTDKKFRDQVVARVEQPQLRRFWELEFGKYSQWMRSEAVSPILNKVGQFLVCSPLRNIVSQRRSSFDIRQVMDGGQILICNLSKGRIGEDNCALLGAMLVSRIQLVALERASQPETERRPCYLYVDEAHNFLTLSFADILSESRKYGLSLILSHQFLGQLDEDIRQAILGNVGTLVAFRVGPEDARVLAREFQPAFEEVDLMNLPNYQIYLKLMIDGTPSPPFSATTFPPTVCGESRAADIIALSRQTYATRLPRLG